MRVGRPRDWEQDLVEELNQEGVEWVVALLMSSASVGDAAILERAVVVGFMLPSPECENMDWNPGFC